MGRLLTILGGLGAGAALMYFMDPEKGRTRRAQVQGKVTGLSNDLRQGIEGRSKDLSNRAKGLLHEAKSTFGRGEQNAQNLGQMPSEHEGMGI
jgi:hypothetical protein